MIKQQRFAPHGTLALHPKAFGLVVDCVDPKPAALAPSGVAVVAIRGPLMHRHDFFFDSYEAIKERITAAVALSPKAILLSIDSPGGLVSGMLDTARAIRKQCADAGVPLLAHVEAQATSAAYALASAAGWIGVSESATIGSIGVIDMLVDATAQNAMMGLSVRLVTSGARKADGNPNASISDDALASSQSRVDTLAAMFFDLVAEHKWGGSADRLRALQAATMTGLEAVSIGLASKVATFDQAIAFASTTDGRAGSEVTAKGNETMATYEEAIAALRKMAEGDDEDAKKAKAALAAMEPDHKEPDGDEGATDGEPDGDEPKPDADASAEDEEASTDAEVDPKRVDAKADAASIAAQALAEVHKINVERANEKATAERSKLLASRPDFAPELVKVLRTAPLAMVRNMVATLPKGPARKDRVAAAASATGTRGDGQGDGFAPRLPPQEKSALDQAMGLAESTTATIHTPNKMSFGVRVPAVAGAQKGK